MDTRHCFLPKVIVSKNCIQIFIFWKYVSDCGLPMLPIDHFWMLLDRRCVRLPRTGGWGALGGCEFSPAFPGPTILRQKAFQSLCFLTGNIHTVMCTPHFVTTRIEGERAEIWVPCSRGL